jgi:hypothetical protein
MLLMDERTHRHRATARIVDELMALKAESAGSAEGRTRGREGRRKEEPMTTARYQLKDDGYSTFQWIMRNRDKVGRVTKNADGSFTGIIGRVQAAGSSWEDAKNQAVAGFEGMDVSKLTSELIRIKPVQERTQAILAWLSNYAETNSGRLVFNNTELARAAGWPRPNQALGNLVSRLDLCCAKTGLPAIGCAADNTFKDAWQRPGANRVQHDWDFPPN